MNIYTDGSCRANKKGAYGFVSVIGGDIDMAFGKVANNTTNNQMEIRAVMMALEYIIKVKAVNVTIHSDSEYVVKGYNIWADNWEKKNWISDYSKKPVKNQGLWKKMLEIKAEIKKQGLIANVKWVRGHHVNKYNNLIDNLVQNLTK